jgi:hypothetical protein
MTFDALMTAAPEERRASTSSRKPAIAHSVPLMQIATQVRALGLAGKRVVLFAPVGDAPAAEGLPQKIADSLAALDRASVLLINLKTVPTGAVAVAAPGQGSTAVSRPAFVEETPRDLLFDRADLSVSRLDAASDSNVDLPSLIESARGTVRYVLLDAPDALENASTLLAAPYTDAVVLVVQRGVAQQRQIAATRKLFATLNTAIAGFIFLD